MERPITRLLAERERLQWLLKAAQHTARGGRRNDIDDPHRRESTKGRFVGRLIGAIGPAPTESERAESQQDIEGCEISLSLLGGDIEVARFAAAISDAATEAIRQAAIDMAAPRLAAKYGDESGIGD